MSGTFPSGDRQFLDRWDERLQQAGRELRYPPTPDIAGAVTRRLRGTVSLPARPVRRYRLALAVLIAVIALASLLAVPQVRAAVVEFLRLGAVRIWLVEPSPTPGPTPAATSTPLASVLDLAGQTTLDDARAKAGFPIRLPGYPPDLGQPDLVFSQDMGGPAVVLAWLEPGQPERVRMSLHELGPGALVEKVQPIVVQETTVHGRRALWAEGPYLVRSRNGQFQIRRLVEGRTLIWTEGEITFRLETSLPLEEAVKIAESLRPVP